MKNVFAIVIFILTVSEPAVAAKFKGYRHPSSAQEFVFIDSIHQVVISDSDFLIQFSHHAAFYRFPIDKDTFSTVKAFLDDCIKSKVDLNIQINPITAQIYQLSSIEK